LLEARKNKLISVNLSDCQALKELYLAEN